jgi:LPS sulfotransferase NodH
MGPGELSFQLRHLKQVVRHRASRDGLRPVRFVIFGRGRSGSTMLVSLLDSLPGVHCDGEILHRRVQFPRQHVHAMCAESSRAAYGCKILSYQLLTVQPLRRRTEFIRRLAHDGFDILYLTRENVVEHAVSNIRARQLGFHQSADNPTINKAITVERDDLMRWIDHSAPLARFARASLVGVPHLALTYERDLAAAALHQTTVQRVGEFLGLPKPPDAGSASEFGKVSPRALRDSVANYEELEAFLRKTPFAKYLSDDDLTRQ